MRDADIARRLCAATDTRPEQLGAIDAHFDVDAATWLGIVPFDLADIGLVDEALTLCDALARLLGEVGQLGDRAMLLARAKRTEHARAAITELRARGGEDLEVLVRCAQVHEVLGDGAEAEALARTVRERARAEHDFDSWCAATELLVGVLRARGANEEADALDADLDRETEGGAPFHDFALAAAVASSPPVVPQKRPAKVGRNDPCPCGSGKKLKKCCG
jgi:hypothetical protein